MLNIFGGPFHDQATSDAFRSIQDTPSLMVDIDEQKKRYTLKLIHILDEHSDYRVHQVKSTVVKFSKFSQTTIDVLKVLHPLDTHRPTPKSDWTNNPPKKRIPYFSGFRI